MSAQEILSKRLWATELPSDVIRILPREMKERAFFSARTHELSYLEKLQKLCASVAAGRMDNATARKEALHILDSLGIQPGGKGMADRTSKRRLDLILDTQRQMAHSVATIKSESPVERALFPAWKLERYGSRRVPRADWHKRWKAAGDSIGWQGASKVSYAALKSSPIWEALGQGVGGYKDTLGNPYPPFAYCSGMDWTAIPREELSRHGLDPATATIPTEVSLSPGAREIREAASKYSDKELEELLR